MNPNVPQSRLRKSAAGLLVGILLATTVAVAGEPERAVFVLTSTNNPAGNAVVVFHLEDGETSTLSYTDSLPTGGNGGASGNAGILRFGRDEGAVANFGSNSVTAFTRDEDRFRIGHTIKLAS